MTESAVIVQPKAERDLRRIGPGPELRRLYDGLTRLGRGDDALDIKPLQGQPGWFRLRIGDHRVLYRLAQDDEGEYLAVERIIHRSQLDLAVRTLPALE